MKDIISTNASARSFKSASATPEWPAYNPNSDILMNFGDTPKAEPAPYRQKIDFIAEWAASQRRR